MAWRQLYLPARGITSTLSLLFAFIYSKDLGVVNRSYVAVIMTFSILLIISMTSGTTLTLRNLPLELKNIKNISSFVSLVLIEGITGLLLFFLALTTFSIFRDHLPQTLILVSCLYFILSGIHLIFMEVLLAYNNFKKASKFEILTILLQMFFYFLLKSFPGVSIAVRLLLSFSVSHLIIAIMCYLWLRSEFGQVTKRANPKFFFKLTKGNHSIATVIGIVDRLDRLIIAWFLPVVLLGKYAVMSSLISFFRFLPDALAKLLISTKSENWGRYLKSRNRLLLGVVGLLILSTVASQTTITRLLGPDWLLPWGVSLTFALQELARGAFQLVGNYKISLGSSYQTHRAAVALLLTAGPLSFILAIWIGIIGVPSGFLLSYLGVLLYLWRTTKLV